MSEPTDPPFQRDELVDKPGIVGARWWQEGLDQADPVARRTALKVMFGAAIGIAAVGGLVALIAKSSAPSVPGTGSASDYDTTQTRKALVLQREYGWSFGAPGEALVFDGQSTAPFDRAALARLADDLSPSRAALRPFFVPTLLESVTAQRKTVPAGDPAPFVPVGDVLQPIFTPAMGAAFRSGRALASLFDAKKHPGAPPIALVVDLPGPESIAFAAGAIGAFDPVLLFDNWPHPRGVVKAHLTLAAAAYFQPLFAKARQRSNQAPPMFLLDRGRLAPYTDDATQFDNRCIARMPSATRLAALGLAHMLCVVPSSSDTRESDDLNEDFVDAARSNMQVRLVADDAFGPDPDAIPSVHVVDAGTSPMPTPDAPLHYYGRQAATDGWFWVDYPWSGTSAKAREPTFPRPGSTYVPTPRSSAFSSGLPVSPMHPTPSDFGAVPVVIAVATGAIIGARMSRNGSWTRSSGWGGG